jgi:ATP-dependent Lhr-like helicase
VERGLWDGVSRGLVMSDGFGAIRARVSGPRSAPRPQRISRLGRTARATAASAGRWSLVPAAPEGESAPDFDGDELAEAVAEQLLNRWGVVFRDLAVRDSLRVPWREVQWALRRLEHRGLVRGGRFVSGFSGEQYALPAAAEQLAHVRKQPRTGERVTVNATDPLNLVGTIVPGDTTPAVRTNHVTYIDGIPEPSSNPKISTDRSMSGSTPASRSA